jgi:hypothetical protein
MGFSPLTLAFSSDLQYFSHRSALLSEAIVLDGRGLPNRPERSIRVRSSVLLSCILDGQCTKYVTTQPWI